MEQMKHYGPTVKPDGNKANRSRLKAMGLSSLPERKIDTVSVEKFPAPWHLTGNGYIFAYKFSKKRSNEGFFSVDFLEDKQFSGFGTVMLVDYHKSTAGPYRELLFIPGHFNYKGKKLYSITKIYVSSMESAVNGRENWGIPKELADFTIEPIGWRKERIIVKKDEELVMDVTLRKFGFPYFVTTKLFPLPLIQKINNKLYFTKFSGRGRSWLTSAKSMKVNSKYFPDISKDRPLFIKRVDNFEIEFPIPTTITVQNSSSAEKI